MSITAEHVPVAEEAQPVGVGAIPCVAVRRVLQGAADSVVGNEIVLPLDLRPRHLVPDKAVVADDVISGAGRIGIAVARHVDPLGAQVVNIVSAHGVVGTNQVDPPGRLVSLVMVGDIKPDNVNIAGIDLKPLHCYRRTS